MNSPRIDQLKRFLEEDPNDPFNWYALALEYVKTDPQEAVRLFTKLLTEYKSYIPTYYQAGQLYLALDDPDTAADIWRTGIAEARAQQDHKAAGELQTVLDELLFE